MTLQITLTSSYDSVDLFQFKAKSIYIYIYVYIYIYIYTHFNISKIYKS